MKKLLSILLTVIALCLTACGNVEEPVDTLVPIVGESIDISMWVFPIGNWADRNIAASVITTFNETHPDINVNLKFLDYTTGDAEVQQAIDEGNTPDIIFEGPERLIVNYAENGLLTNLNDMYHEYYTQSIPENIKKPCMLGEDYYMMPLCTTAHCMVINKDMFRACGALDLIDERTRRWTAEDFFKALDLLSDWGVEKPCIIYCDGQAGDQGTRMLINNLAGSYFTNSQHTQYTVNCPENVKILTELKNNSNVYFGTDMDVNAAIEAFCSEECAMLFCWNAALSVKYEIASSYIEFNTMPVNFPTINDKVIPRLDSGVWGFCVFDNGDENRIAAAKTFIQELASDTPTHEKAITASSYWPVITCKDVYVNDAFMEEYSQFIANIGDFYQITDNWTKAREGWWTMLKAVGNGVSPETALDNFDKFLSSD